MEKTIILKNQLLQNKFPTIFLILFFAMFIKFQCLENLLAKN